MFDAFSQDRNTTGIYGENRMAPYEVSRIDRMSLLAKMQFPDCYTQNSQKENLCLDFVENFRLQFFALFPQRPPLLLSPLNECGQKKFISTFLRSSVIRFPELYDHESIATYVANYMLYEPLEDPEALPTRIVSPSTSLLWQVGNSIEMSLVLCSMLLGAGYNAFCVVGYATKDVCDNDQSKTMWPSALPREKNSDDESEKMAERETQFTNLVKKRPLMTSEFDTAEEARHKRELDEIIPPDVAVDPIVEEARLFHSWCLLMPTKLNPPLHNVREPLFVEPTTGAIVRAADATKYLGIESIFNAHNYFVNMNPQLPVAEVSLALRDLSKWEHVFLTDAEMDEEPAPVMKKPISLSDTASLSRTGMSSFEEATEDTGVLGDQVIDTPPSWVMPLTLSRAQYENRYPGRRKKVAFADVTIEYFAEYSDPEMRVTEIRIPEEQQEEVHTFYKHREDKLRRRSVLPSFDRSQAAREIHEWFDPGRKRESKVEGLRELIVIPGVKRIMRFFWRAREDGLSRRIENFFERDTHVRKIQEYYRGRDDDHLIYRSATFEIPKETSTSVTLGLAHIVAPSQRDDTSRVPIKMTEKFSPNPKIPPQQDIAKRTYIKPQASDGEIWVLFQYNPNCVTRAYRQYPKNADKDKDGTASNVRDLQPKVVTMPFEEPPRDHELLEELRVLLVREKDCLAEIAARQEESKEILDTRKREQGDVRFTLSMYDTLRNRPRETEAELEQMRAEEARRAESKKDYLSPYIANSEVGKQCKGDYQNVRLSVEVATKVRDECLRDLKERLIQRGHIMQARMDKQQEEIKRRQDLYQKNLDSTESTKDSEEFSQFCKDAAWRIKILDERLSRHIEQAAEKYAKRAEHLAKDPRLASIYGNPKSD